MAYSWVPPAVSKVFLQIIINSKTEVKSQHLHFIEEYYLPTYIGKIHYGS